MILKFVFSTGETEILLMNDAHPIFQSPFIQNVLECHEGDNTTNSRVNVDLPRFISRSDMVEFLDFLVLDAGDCAMGFGKYYEMTYRWVVENDPEYHEWGRSQGNPSPWLKEFVDWGEGKSKPESPETLLPIDKYFQVDMCARCGVLGSLEGSSSPFGTTNLQPCRRTGWPRVPTVPDYESVTRKFVPFKSKDAAWTAAWKLADRDREESGRVVCHNDDVLCPDCISRVGCPACKEYDCDDCKKDTETSKVFEEWHKQYPNAWYEDEYGRRGDPPCQVMDISRCLQCGNRVCRACGQECDDCHRKACERCKEDLNTWCKGCRSTIENNGDNAIWPIDRDEYVCRECFYRRPHFCECGEPSYDPAAPQPDSDDGSINSYDSFSDPDGSDGSTSSNSSAEQE